LVVHIERADEVVIALDEETHGAPGFIGRVVARRGLLEEEEVVVVGQDGVEEFGAGIEEAELLVAAGVDVGEVRLPLDAHAWVPITRAGMPVWCASSTPRGVRVRRARWRLPRPVPMPLAPS
jgi:hypothetical protein